MTDVRRQAESDTAVAGRLLAAISAAVLAVSAFLPWIDAAHGFPARRGSSIPVRQLFRGIGDAQVGFWRSAGVIVVVAAVLVAIAGVARSRALAVLGALVALAVLADWVALEAVHRAPANTVIGDFRAGAWLLLCGVALTVVTAVMLTPRRSPGR